MAQATAATHAAGPKKASRHPRADAVRKNPARGLETRLPIC